MGCVSRRRGGDHDHGSIDHPVTGEPGAVVLGLELLVEAVRLTYRTEQGSSGADGGMDRLCSNSTLDRLSIRLPLRFARVAPLTRTR